MMLDIVGLVRQAQAMLAVNACGGNQAAGRQAAGRPVSVRAPRPLEVR